MEDPLTNNPHQLPERLLQIMRVPSGPKLGPTLPIVRQRILRSRTTEPMHRQIASTRDRSHTQRNNHRRLHRVAMGSAREEGERLESTRLPKEPSREAVRAV